MQEGYTLECDDGCNSWGTSLLLDNPGPAPGKERDGGLSQLESCIRKSTDDRFHLFRVTSSGSEANALAIITAAQGETDSCMFAAGSYISGDEGILQGWSTSSVANSRCCLSSILKPEEVESQFAKTHTIALPYYIEGCFNAQELRNYENSCFEELHIRLLLNRARGRPTKILMLELVLAGNGAKLSKRALTILGRLAEKHQFKMHVDEIFTCARFGRMFQTTAAPIPFLKEVTSIAIGKWTGIGMVLYSSFLKKRVMNQKRHAPARGISTGQYRLLQHVVKIWKRVEGLQLRADEKRDLIVDSLKLDKEKIWGAGLAIYGPYHQPRAVEGFRNRFTPLAEIDSVLLKIAEPRYDKTCEKEAINESITTAVKSWIAASPTWSDHFEQSIDGDIGAAFTVGNEMSMYAAANNNMRHLVDVLCRNSTPTNCRFRLETISTHARFLNKSYTRDMVIEMLANAKRGGLVTNGQTTVASTGQAATKKTKTRRVRYWQVKEIVMAPSYTDEWSV